MNLLIGIGTLAAYGYSALATLAPGALRALRRAARKSISTPRS